jgi:NAD(P)-dependent dehydrogenase (short-subunit alcohol dehydrogenase family)
MATVLVTGTSKGIGFETALAFGRAGHRVAATMRSPGNSPELAAVAAREKLPITVSALDVDSDESVRDGVARITKEIGQIDVLVNNAGIERTGSVEELPMADFRDVMETNYFGPIRCIQAVLPSMRERRSGTIINVTSVAGIIALAPMAPYAASKFAIEALSECLAQEVKAFNIRVAMIEPGITDTPMARHLSIDALPSPYPHKERMAALYKAMLQQPIPPTLAADKALEIATSGTWQLRHRVGPDAEPFVGWRRAMSDEQWADFGALGDEAWYARVEADFGVNARPLPTSK